MRLSPRRALTQMNSLALACRDLAPASVPRGKGPDRKTTRLSTSQSPLSHFYILHSFHSATIYGVLFLLHKVKGSRHKLKCPKVGTWLNPPPYQTCDTSGVQKNK